VTQFPAALDSITEHRDAAVSKRPPVRIR